MCGRKRFDLNQVTEANADLDQHSHPPRSRPRHDSKRMLVVIVSDGECPHSHEVCRALHPRQLSRNENLRLSLVFLVQCRMARADTPSLTDTSKRALKHACQFCIPVLTSAHLHTCAAYQLNLGRALVALSRSVAWSMRCCSLAICNAIPAWYCTGRPGMTCHMGENVFISCSWQHF